MTNFNKNLLFDILACACLETSGVATLRQTSTRKAFHKTA